MPPYLSLPRTGCRAAALVLLWSTCIAGAQVAPAFERSALSLGHPQASTLLSGTVWLQLQNKSALDAEVKAMYAPGSSTFRRFADAGALRQYAPPSAAMSAVRRELAVHNLSVLNVDPYNFSVRIQGKTSDFEAAFHTAVSQYRMQNGAVVSAFAAAPALGDSAAGLVSAVTGISGADMTPFNRIPTDPATGKQIGLVPATAKPQGAIFSPNCLYAPSDITLTTPGPILPAGVYGGLVYGAPPADKVPGTISPCGYSPQDVYKLFGLTAVFKQGYTGLGETIAIVDAYGSPTIQSDLAAFNSTYGLPQSTADSFKVVQTTPFKAANATWAQETTLDVEWAHAIAPGANIVLITTPTQNDDDLQSGVLYAIENQLAHVISNSYGQGELTADAQTVEAWDEICELGAFLGISVNFASGDNGDYKAVEEVTDVSLPADSPFATAVGGISAAYSPFDGASLVQTGWGTNATQLGGVTGAIDPPMPLGFQFGAGGGVSRLFPLPDYQSALGGTGRHLPDVSALADPYTGVEIFLTIDGIPYYEVIGGTSLATPIFSGEWTLLDQRSGAPLGQAAPYIAAYAGNPVITDILPPSQQFAVQGVVVDAGGTTEYAASALAQPETRASFTSALYNNGGGDTYVLTFGTDSSLAVTAGWDPVTGFGTLNMPMIFSEP